MNKCKRNVGAVAPKSAQKGITLIALVITIIVMLILVAVTISMAVNGGLFDYAGRAVGETQNAINEEQLLADGKVKVDGIWYDSIDSYIDGTMSQDNTLLGLYKAGKLKVGDYVDYTPSSAEPYNPDDPERTGTAEVGTLTGYTDENQNISQEKLKWRVLGVDGENVLLISGAPTTNVIEFYGHIGYNNCETVLDNTCASLYSNSGIGATARSINLNDVDTYLGGSAFDKTTYHNYGDSNSVSNIYIPENWEGTNTLSLTSTAYAYTISEVVTDVTKLELFIGKDASKPYYYWINSRCCYTPGAIYWGLNYTIDGFAAFDYDYFWLCTGVGGDESGYGLCMRPVISLNSSVTTEQVPILETIPSESWNDPIGWY